MNIMASLAEFERSLIAERVTAGMDRARCHGKHLGRPSAFRRPRVEARWDELRRLVEKGELSTREAGPMMGVSAAWVSRHTDRTGSVAKGGAEKTTRNPAWRRRRISRLQTKSFLHTGRK